MHDVTIVSEDIAPYRSPSIERLSRELAQMPLTEACVSGLCDICLYQAGLCMTFGQHGEDPHKSRHSAEQKNKS